MDEPRERRPASVTAGVAVVAVVVLSAFLYYAGLAVFATEGDVPAASTIALPEGSEVVEDSVECASGGCWRSLSVRPPETMTPEALSSELKTTPQARIPGTLLDPRTVRVTSEVRGSLLIVRADLWSREPAP